MGIWKKLGYMIIIIMISNGQSLGQLERSIKHTLEMFHFD
jgi:hypothetical protein